MLPRFRGALSRVWTRVAGSRFAKPAARVALAVAGLLLLAFVGRTAVAGAMAPRAEPSAVPPAAAPALAPSPPVAAPVAAPPDPAPPVESATTTDPPPA